MIKVTKIIIVLLMTLLFTYHFFEELQNQDIAEGFKNPEQNAHPRGF